jgi:hypothetical protein
MQDINTPMSYWLQLLHTQGRKPARPWYPRLLLQGKYAEGIYHISLRTFFLSFLALGSEIGRKQCTHIPDLHFEGVTIGGRLTGFEFPGKVVGGPTGGKVLPTRVPG